MALPVDEQLECPVEAVGNSAASRLLIRRYNLPFGLSLRGVFLPLQQLRLLALRPDAVLRGALPAIIRSEGHKLSTAPEAWLSVRCRAVAIAYPIRVNVRVPSATMSQSWVLA